MTLGLGRGRRVKHGSQKRLKGPTDQKENANSKHYFEEKNPNTSIGNNKVTKLVISNGIS